MNENLGTCPPEKIVIVLDLGDEINECIFSRSAPKTQQLLATLTNTKSKLDIIKKALNIFLLSKSTLNDKHQFSLVVMTEGAVAVTDGFSSNVNDLIQQLSEINTQGLFNQFSMDSILGVLAGFGLSMPKQTVHFDTPTVEYVTRVIFIYARSDRIPVFSVPKSLESLKKILSYNFFFFDYIYLFTPSEHNADIKQQFEAFMKEFCQKSYCFSISCSQPLPLLSLQMEQAMYAAEDNIITAFAHLLAHPLQRPARTLQ